MKNILALLFIGLMICSCGSTKEVVEETTPEVVEEVEPKPRGHEGRKPRVDVDDLVAQLGLSEEQETEFLEMWYGSQDKLRAIREEHRGDRSTMREEMKALREKRNTELETILTEAQLKKYYEILDANRRKMGGKPKRHGGGN